MSRFMRGLFQTARTISTIDPTAGYGHRGEAPPAPLFVVCATLEHMFRSIPPALFRQCFGVSCDICAGVIVIKRDCMRGHVVSVVMS